MASSRQARGVEFHTADPRAVIPLVGGPGDGGGPKVARSLKALVRKRPFVITTDIAFGQVICACADEPRTGEAGQQSWINDWIINAFTLLHHAGHAHSVEAWREGQLVGGLYGVHIGGAFFGESMFSRHDAGGENASKVCFVHLVRHLQARGFTLLDTQFANPHTLSLGAVEVAREEYLKRLATAVEIEAEWGTIRATDHRATDPGSA